MIKTKKQLKETIREEKQLYFPEGIDFVPFIVSENNIKIFQYVKMLRKTEYHYNNKSNVFHRVLYAICRRRKNILGRRLGIEMWENTFDSGLQIYHAGNIVVNGMCKIGKNCILYGDNCIGNDANDFDAPILGDNVRVCVGAKIIGGIEIANNVTIAAGAVVIRSCLTENAILAGVPAKVVKISEE